MIKVNESLWYCGPKNCQITFPKANGKPQILVADLDGTLVTTNSGRKHPKNADDWVWIEGALEKIQACRDKGIPIIIVTNQAGISHSEKKNSSRKDLLLRRILNISEEAEGVQFWIAGNYDNYRKPNTGIFEEYIWPQAPDCENWVYIGDAAGREGDHSDTDRKFAYNINLLLTMKSSNREKLLARVHSKRSLEKPSGEGSSLPKINDEEAKLMATVDKMPMANLDAKKIENVPTLALPKSTEPNRSKSNVSASKNTELSNTRLELKSPQVSARVRNAAANLAAAAKISFLTPEEFIYKESPRTRQFNGFDPKAYLASLPKNAETNQNLLLAKIKQALLEKPSLLIMIGYPASGKSTLALKLADPNIHIIHKDLVAGNQHNLQNQIVDQLRSGKSVILDATNPKRIGRMAICQDVKMRAVNTPIYYLNIHCSLDLAKHMNRWRAWLTNNQTLSPSIAIHKKPLPAPALMMFMNNYQEPSLDEGVNNIFNTSVIPVFTSEESKVRFLQLSE